MLRAGFHSGICVGAIVSASPPFVPDPIPTPAITKTSPSGDPLAFSVESIGYVVGYYWNLQIAGSSNFLTNYPGEGAIRDEVRLATMTDFTDDDNDGTVEMDPFDALTGQRSGTAYLRIRLGRESDDGLSIDWGAWSNTISDTVVLLTPSTLSASGSYAWATLTNGNLTLTSNPSTEVNAAIRFRSTQARDFHSHFEVRIDDLHGESANDVVSGVCTSTLALQGAFGPGTGFSGIAKDGAWYADGAYQGTDAAYAQVEGDILTFDCDPATNTLKVSKNGGAWKSMALPTSTEDFYVCAMVNPRGSATDLNGLTVNFGASAFLVAPSGGAAAFT